MSSPSAAAASVAPPPQSSLTSLFVGNLDARVYRELLHDIFSLAGPVTQCHVVFDKATGLSSGFGFVHFATHMSAADAMDRFRGRSIYGKTLTIDWARATPRDAQSRVAVAATAAASSSASPPDAATSAPAAAPTAGAAAGTTTIAPPPIGQYCLFVGNLSPDVTDAQLVTAFSEFGSCTSAKCARDPATLKTQGFAFVSFRDREHAAAALDAMNGQMLHHRALRVDWAKGKSSAAGARAPTAGSSDEPGAGAPGSAAAVAAGGEKRDGAGGLSFDAVLNQTSVTNVTAYVSGLSVSTTEETLRGTFSAYGAVREIRIPESGKSPKNDSMYAFVRFQDHTAAAKAVFECQRGVVVDGHTAQVHWGRENRRMVMAHAARAPTAAGTGMAPPPHGYFHHAHAQPPHHAHAAFPPHHPPPPYAFASAMTAAPPQAPPPRGVYAAPPYARAAPPGAAHFTSHTGPQHRYKPY